MYTELLVGACVHHESLLYFSRRVLCSSRDPIFLFYLLNSFSCCYRLFIIRFNYSRATIVMNTVTSPLGTELLLNFCGCVQHEEVTPADYQKVQNTYIGQD